MSRCKFNPKIFEGKRISRAISSNQGINKLHVWNTVTKMYQPPGRGGAYLAKKRILINGKRTRLTKSFQSLLEAQNWMKDISKQNEANASLEVKSGVKFKDVFKNWENSAFKNLRSGSQVFYMNRKRYLDYFFEMNMSDITSYTIDEWFVWLKQKEYQVTRTSFNNELNFLKVIFNFHVEHSEKYISPVKKRHTLASAIKDSSVKSKNLNESEFNSFVAELKKQKNGNMFAALATIQYFQALRVSEVAALGWSDIQFECLDKKKSKLIVRKAVKWIRKKGIKPSIEDNIKNSRTLVNGYKLQPMLPQTYQTLMNFKSNAFPSDLIFTTDGEPLEYRAIQNAFDRAFKSAGLIYRSTHILRHGGCRRSFNKHGDLSIAQQQLGNKTMSSVLVYAVREESAYFNEVAKEWDLVETSN